MGLTTENGEPAINLKTDEEMIEMNHSFCLLFTVRFYHLLKDFLFQGCNNNATMVFAKVIFNGFGGTEKVILRTMNTTNNLCFLTLF